MIVGGWVGGRRSALLLTVLAVVLVGCRAGSDPSPPNPSSGAAVPSPAPAAPSAVRLPPAAARVSYQIGGAFAPAAGVGVIDRDRADAPLAGRYSICYLNAFQAQTADVAWWTGHDPTLLLRDPAGHLVIDEQWNEPLFDISTPGRRAGLMNVIGPWIDGCARRGYQAVEPDNLDSYTRSDGELSAADALAFARALAERAHHDGLAIAQKNAPDLSVAAHAAGLDFAIAEECQVYAECSAYTAVYGDHVIEIEYTDQPRSAFTAACRERGATISVLLRDRDVAAAGQPGYLERWC